MLLGLTHWALRSFATDCILALQPHHAHLSALATDGEADDAGGRGEGTLCPETRPTAPLSLAVGQNAV